MYNSISCISFNCFSVFSVLAISSAVASSTCWITDVLSVAFSSAYTFIEEQHKNKVIKTKKRKQNNLAIMIKEDGATDYTKSNSKDIPKGDYVLNRDKSYCKNNV